MVQDWNILAYRPAWQQARRLQAGQHMSRVQHVSPRCMRRSVVGVSCLAQLEAAAGLAGGLCVHAGDSGAPPSVQTQTNNCH